MHLAASTSETDVARTLDKLLDQALPFDYAAVKSLARPGEAKVPHVEIGAPTFEAYDALIAMAGAA